MTKTKVEDDFPIAGRMLATPQPDRLVRKPDGSALPPEGEAVNVDENRSYWLRKLNDGDVQLAPAPEVDGDEA